MQINNTTYLYRFPFLFESGKIGSLFRQDTPSSIAYRMLAQVKRVRSNQTRDRVWVVANVQRLKSNTFFYIFPQEIFCAQEQPKFFLNISTLLYD